MIITSVKNPLIVQIKKIRDEFDGRLFLDNPKLVEEAINADLNISNLIVDEEKLVFLKEKFVFLKNFEDKIQMVTKNVIDSLSLTKTSQGLIAIVDVPKKNISDSIGNRFIVLEDLQDPGNIGTIIRSACGTNFRDIILIGGVSPYNQKVVRSTMGGLFKLNIHQFSNIDEFAKFARNKKLNIYCATMDGENLYSQKIADKSFGIAIGNEGNGISKKLKDLCNRYISIPMKNNLESLNAAVACSIIIYYFDNIN